MRPLLVILCVGALGCASRQHLVLPNDLFDDGAFGPPSANVDPSSVLAVSEPMKQYLRDVVGPRMKWQTPHAALVDALYERGMLRLTYDTESTRTASEAFDARAGNCLSLVLMTVAFARELGIPYRVQSVQTQETWGREGELLLFACHVNVVVGPGARRQFGELSGESFLVDFLPTGDRYRQRSFPIDEATVLSMFSNNRAAEALAQDRVDDAYGWAREAIRRDHRFANAHNTLGLVYLRHGQPERAEVAFRFALELEPKNAHALANLATALKAMHRDDEAAEVALRSQALERTPFTEFRLGQQAQRQGELELARRHYERALRLGGEAHELHFALAQVLVTLGDVDGAARHLEFAEAASGTKGLQALYAQKLERLRRVSGQQPPPR